MRKRFAVVIDKEPGTDFGVQAPDVPGCIAIAESRDEALRLFAEALVFHFEGMAEGEIPEPSASVEYIEIEIPVPATTR